MFNMLPGFTLTKDQQDSLHDYRLQRLRQVMEQADVGLCILNNPVSLRYVIDFDEYPIFQSHIPCCYLYVPIAGPLVMFGATARNFPYVEDYQRPHFISVFDAGFDLAGQSKVFTDDVMGFMAEQGLTGQRIAIERFSPLTNQALLGQGLTIVDAEVLVEQAKLIKNEEEIMCMQRSVAVAQHGMQQMQAALQPGVTENQLWSILHQVNIAHDGDWIEGRMLASGHRTNPWLQEATNKVIKAGELVAFDTDMIGPKGYIADISRTWLCGDGPANGQQKAAYQHAYDEIHFNMALIKPGVSFSQLSKNSFNRSDKYRNRRYPTVIHGVGLSDEYPKIYYQEDWPRDGYDGLIAENMVLCLESFSGAQGEAEGVKLETQVRVTPTGCVAMSDYAFEDVLLR
ncbi:MAG TPA: aminopeptidase [Oceanospirillaceae bacterium]|nr:aminopeptidase [Oceanospirillaceae bacterium]